MTLYEYKLLSDHEQYDLLFTKGEFITSRRDNKRIYALYALEKFFVQVEYSPKSNKIINKICFVNGNLLDIYSDEIKYL